MLDPEEIRSALATTRFRSGFHHFPTIGSTNSYALEQAQDGAPDGSYFVADEQTAGRGRSDHNWHSAAGLGLYLSVLIRPRIAASELVWLPLIAGLAAHSNIQEVTGLVADLRWPNDILIGPRKVAGILVEALTDSGRVNAAVIGIGINIHQQRFPSDVSTPATSLDLESGRGHPGDNTRQQLLITFLQILDRELAMIEPAETRAAALAAIPNRVEAISTWIRNRQVEVHGPQPCTGTTAGLDDNGFLRVLTAGGPVTITTGGIRAAQNPLNRRL
jgi:BirA family biotin operon repressor/biotin-[acetyl-CoA-carboxylase] ligase